jgi:hypothetical protein
MILDPRDEEQAHNPYVVLRATGITPMTSLQAVQNVSFVLMSQGGMSYEQRQAWDELRIIPRRLITDFFLYGTIGEQQ